jgi:hypothetical protein
MCISSRQTSQGTQRIYTVNTTPLDSVKVTVNVNTHAYDSDSEEEIQRAPMSACFNNDSDSEEDVQKSCVQRACFQSGPCERSPGPSSYKPEPEPDEYEVSNDCMEDSPYLTHTATNVMRSISYNSDEEKEKEKEKEKDEDAILENEDDDNDSDSDNSSSSSSSSSEDNDSEKE